MNTHVFIVVECLPDRVHGGNLVIRELTPEQKTSAKFAINIHDLFSSVYSITISMSDEENESTASDNSSSKNTSEDAFSQLSEQLDNALQQQKNEIFNVLEGKIPVPSVDTSKKEFKYKYISNTNQCDFNECFKGLKKCCDCRKFT